MKTILLDGILNQNKDNLDRPSCQDSTHTHTHTCLLMDDAHTRTNARTHARAHARTHACTRAHTHSRTHTLSHTHTAQHPPQPTTHRQPRTPTPPHVILFMLHICIQTK